MPSGFEPRPAALICIDGCSSLTKRRRLAAEEARVERAARDGDGFDAVFSEATRTSINLRWLMEQGAWALHDKSAFDLVRRVEPLTSQRVGERIDCPVPAGKALHDRLRGPA